jgi:hypothetical protein
MSDNWTSAFETYDGSILCLVTGEACKFKYPVLSCISCGRIPLIHQKGGFSKGNSVPCSAGGTCEFTDTNTCKKCGNNKPVQHEGVFQVAVDDNVFNNNGINFDVS